MSDPEAPASALRTRAGLRLEDERMSDVYEEDKPSVENRLGYMKGQLDALKEQVKNVHFADDVRFSALENKVEMGFERITADVNRHFDDLGKRTTDLAEKLARGQGAVSVLDRVLGWVVPCLLGGVATMLVFHMKLIP
jgi:hypothetical protein